MNDHYESIYLRLLTARGMAKAKRGFLLEIAELAGLAGALQLTPDARIKTLLITRLDWLISHVENTAGITRDTGLERLHAWLCEIYLMLLGEQDGYTIELNTEIEHQGTFGAPVGGE